MKNKFLLAFTLIAFSFSAFASNSNPGGVPVPSVFTRTGPITAQTGDYTVSQVTGAAPLASPNFTGTLGASAATFSGAVSFSALADGCLQTVSHVTTSTGSPCGSGGGAVSSVFGRTGSVVAVNGDYTTAQVTESGSLYFTNARAIASTLTGYTSGSGTISATDTIISAIQKLNGNDGLKANLASPTFTGTVTLPAGQIVNGVTLTTGGSATSFLNATGAYTTPAGSGNVTAGGTLTSNSIIIGAGTTAVSALGSLGTTTTVLHGNAAGAPTFGAVAIATDVSGLGTGVATFLGTPSSANLAAALTDETGTGAAVFANSATLINPALGTPASGVATNLTGTASGLTAGTVTTNANLTGPIASTGNATSITSQTGTGTTFAMSASPAFTGTLTGAAATWSGIDTALNFAATGTGANTLPVGSTANRPGSPVNGMLRYNSTTPAVEAYVNNAWTSLGLAGVNISGDVSIGTTGASSIVSIQGTTVAGTTGTGNSVFSATPTLSTATIQSSSVISDAIMKTGTVSATTLTRTSSTAFTQVPNTTIAMAAGGSYSCHGHLSGASDITGGIKAAVNTTDGTLTATSLSFTGTNWNGIVPNAKSTATSLNSAFGAATAVYTDMDIDGAIVVNAGGNFGLFAAQNASSATSTTVLLNSYFSCVRTN